MAEKQKLAEVTRQVLVKVAHEQPVDISSSDFHEGGVEPWPDFESSFSDLIYRLRGEGHISFEDSYSGTEGETWFITATASERPESKKLYLEDSGMTKLNATELRAARDRVISYIYENGAANYGYSMPTKDIVENTGVDQFQLREVVGLLINQGLMSASEMQSIGLNSNGQLEAERLGPKTPMRAVEPNSFHIDARYSIVQIAGSNSTQNANLRLDAAAAKELLDTIEGTLATLNLEPVVLQEANGLLASLQESALKGAGDAVSRAVAGALGSILTAAGSPLGKGLLAMFGISV
jgi:hypothetical protein